MITFLFVGLPILFGRCILNFYLSTNLPNNLSLLVTLPLLDIDATLFILLVPDAVVLLFLLENTVLEFFFNFLSLASFGVWENLLTKDI